MKSKKIDKLRYEDYDGTEMCRNVCTFLETLKIKSATEAADEFQGILEEEFCGECKVTKDSCDCKGQHDYDHDYDRLYDAWKDAQLENAD